MRLHPSFAASLALFASAVVAQDPVELAGSTYLKAQPLERTNPDYPASALSAGREGWVMVSFVISPTGETTELMIEDSSGTESLDRAALKAVGRWKYRPATRDGEPVEQAMVETVIRFQLERGGEPGASRAFIAKYREIGRHINAKNFAVAGPLIAELESGERNSLYEDAWLWWTKFVFLSASGSADTAEMQRSLQRAIGYEQEFLAPDLFVAAAERLFVLQAKASDISAAMETFERLRDAKTARRSDNYDAALANLQGTYDQMLQLINGEEIIAVQAQVKEFDYWVHDLLRRSFSLANIDGRLDVLDIRCERGTRRYSVVPANMIWTVPESWGDCGAYIKGEPGATFAFHEYPRSYAPPAAVNVETQ